MNYLGSFSTSVSGFFMGEADNPSPSPQASSPTPPHPTSPTTSTQHTDGGADYETLVDCTSFSQCITSYYNSTPMTNNSTNNLPETPTASQLSTRLIDDEHKNHHSIMDRTEIRGHMTHHPHHNSVIGLFDVASPTSSSTTTLVLPRNHFRAVPRGILIQLKLEEQQHETLSSSKKKKMDDDETDDESDAFLSVLSREERISFEWFGMKCENIKKSSPTFIEPTRWELREMAVNSNRYSNDFIFSRYLNYCNFVQEEPGFGSIPYWAVLMELKRGYYTLAGDDLHGCPIVILEQSKVDGNIDYMVRVQTAITTARAVAAMDLSYARNGVSMFADLRNVGWNNISLKFQRYIYTLMRNIFYYSPGFMALYQTPTIVRWAFKLSKPFISETYREMGMNVLEKNDKAENNFDWFARMDQLPPKYGGTYDNERNLYDVVRTFLINCGVREEELVAPPEYV